VRLVTSSSCYSGYVPRPVAGRRKQLFVDQGVS
jgi:hypothetical protein